MDSLHMAQYTHTMVNETPRGVSSDHSYPAAADTREAHLTYIQQNAVAEESRASSVVYRTAHIVTSKKFVVEE